MRWSRKASGSGVGRGLPVDLRLDDQEIIQKDLKEGIPTRRNSK